LDPENPQALIQVSRLLFGQGKVDEAFELAERARRLALQDPVVLSTWGFLTLARGKMNEAIGAFDRAIVQDSTRGEPHLGKGLALFRRGKTEDGVKEMRIATLLEPKVSLYHSYLGKAFYEVKEDKPAEQQLVLAKELDPRDPTPYFYDAIFKQTINRPVEALRDLQKSIELNDNRAVYRSRLLLDEDRAVRGTSLARIYDDLGFDKRALIEASKSLSLAPADYSAHRFLSDTYGRLPRHQIARVSELLQAQLLQPININPVQPQLNETNLNIVTGAGPARAAFNEYARLFERNRPQLVLSGILGNNTTFGDEAVLSGIHNRISYSLGQFHYETDGFREKADVKHDIYNAFAQVALTEKFNVQFEYRRRETDQGDLRLNFDPNFVPEDQQSLEQDTGRLGLHLALSPRSDLIGSLIYSNRTSELQRDTTDFTNQIRRNSQGYDAQGQYLFQSTWFNFALGGGIYKIDRNTLTITDFRPEACNREQRRRPLQGCREERESSPFTEESNAFAYTNILFPKNLTWTLGLSYDSFDDEMINLNKLNPKVGFQWDITDHLRLRAAYLRTLKRLFVVDQTIEPTQVAGFNQFFDDFGGTRTELLGAGLDIKATDGLFAGFEFTRRNLDVPIGNQIDDQTEDLYRAYTYWTPHSRWTFSAEYRRRSADVIPRRFFDLRSEIPPPNELETTTIPLSIRYFSPLGVFAELGATFVQQQHIVQQGSESNSNTEDFFVLDTAIGYRLAKRRGIISLEVKNLLNEDFLFQDLEVRTSDPFVFASDFIPDRTILARITLNFF
jgi:tetratricopeptide (TPR) repeat protein